MGWASLQLWAEDEEKRIHDCLVTALRQLIAAQTVGPEDGELKISGQLRPYLYRSKKQLKLSWTLHCEAAAFAEVDSERPYGHPDIRFSSHTLDHDQYDYDVECKLVRTKREGKSRNYCQHYVIDGVKRFQVGKYAQSNPPMGAMIGYVQEGEWAALFSIMINEVNQANNLAQITLQSSFSARDVSHLTQKLERTTDSCLLIHFWADLR